MNCRQTLEMLEMIRPSGEELAEPEFAQASEHIQGCPKCLEQYRTIQRADQWMADKMADVPVPAGLQQRILHRLEASPSWRLRPWLVPLSAAAILLVGLSVLFFNWPDQPPELTQLGLDEVAERLTHETVEAVLIDTSENPQLLQKLEPLIPARWPRRLNVTLTMIGEKRISGIDVPIAVLRYEDSRGNLVDLFAFPREQFEISGTENSPVLLRKSRHVVAWKTQTVTYLAVFEGEVPEQWYQPAV